LKRCKWEAATQNAEGRREERACCSRQLRKNSEFDFSFFQGGHAAILKDGQYLMEHILLLHLFPLFPSDLDVASGVVNPQ
jgi:hypothetical protein